MKILKSRHKDVVSGLFTFLLLFGMAGPGKAMDKVFTIGVLNDVPILSDVLTGFKAGMTELGYVEGKNIRYLYKGPIEDDQKVIDAEIRRLLSQDIDIFLTLGINTTVLAKKAAEYPGIPVLMCPALMPVESGLIESMTHPGGNITGVAAADTAPKTLEWLKMVVPGLKKIYLPYNPDEEESILGLTGLDKVASQLGIELIHHRVHSVEEAVTAIMELPDDVKAVLRVPSPTLDARNCELTQAAIRRGIPVGARLQLDKDVLFTFASDLNDIGRQTARLAHQIRQGVKAGDLPVEMSEVFLIVNLKTAEKLGLYIPNDILAQAKIIIR